MKQSLKYVILLLIGIAIGVGSAIAISVIYSKLSDRTVSDTGTAIQNDDEPQGQAKSADLSPSEESELDLEIDLHKVVELGSSFSRRAALYSLLENANEKELVRMLSQSKTVSPISRRQELQTAIFRKFATMNPTAALREVQEIPKLQQGPLIFAVFQEWSSTELQEAIAHAEPLIGSQRTTAVEAILGSRSDLTAKQKLEIAQRLRNEDIARILIVKEELSKHIGNPSEQWNIIVNDDVDDTNQIESLTQVAELWKQEIGFEVLVHVQAAELDSYALHTTLIRRLTEDDPEAALNFLLSTQGEQRELIGRTVAGSWARSEPLAAFNALESFEPPWLRNSLRDSVAYVWASTDPVSLLENASLLDPANRTIPLGVALAEIARSSPQLALVQLETLAESIDDTTTFERSIVSAWSEQDPQTAVDWILSNYNPDDPKRSQLLPNALGNLSLENPHKAMRLALEQPVPTDQQPPEYRIIRQMSWNAELEVVADFLSRVRPDPKTNSRSYVFGLVGEAFIRNEQFDKAVKLAGQLPESQREKYFTNITYSWAYADPIHLYENLESLPTAKAKKYAAQALESINGRRPVLSDEQIDAIRTYLVDEVPS